MTEWIDDVIQGRKEFDLEDYKNKTRSINNFL